MGFLFKGGKPLPLKGIKVRVHLQNFGIKVRVHLQNFGIKVRAPPLIAEKLQEIAKVFKKILLHLPFLKKPNVSSNKIARHRCSKNEQLACIENPYPPNIDF